MKKLILLFLLVFPLIGCVPAIIIAGAAGATLEGAVVYNQRSYKTMNQDHNTRVIIQTKIDHNPKLKKQSHISISVFNNIALLVGQTKDVELRDCAYKITITTPHVQHAYNEITINAPISTMKRVNDFWITTKVRTAMFRKSGLRSCNLKVITENKIVYLMGIVNPKQAFMASEIARHISGVQKVVKVFEYE